MIVREVRSIAAGLLLTGCALGSPVTPVAPGTFALAEMRAPVRGGGAEAERVVLARAAAFCQRQGGTVVLLDVRPGGDPRTAYWPTAFNAVFQCRPGIGASPGP